MKKKRGNFEVLRVKRGGKDIFSSSINVSPPNIGKSREIAERKEGESVWENIVLRGGKSSITFQKDFSKYWEKKKEEIPVGGEDCSRRRGKGSWKKKRLGFLRKPAPRKGRCRGEEVLPLESCPRELCLARESAARLKKKEALVARKVL